MLTQKYKLFIIIGVISLFSLILIFTMIRYSGKSIHLRDRGKGLYGIDVSRHQGKINWTKVKKWREHKISFVYIKAT